MGSVTLKDDGTREYRLGRGGGGGERGGCYAQGSGMPASRPEYSEECYRSMDRRFRSQCFKPKMK